METGKLTHFKVLTRGAGKAPLHVSFSGSVEDFDIIDNYDYSYTVKYTPVQQVGHATVGSYDQHTGAVINSRKLWPTQPVENFD